MMHIFTVSGEGDMCSFYINLQSSKAATVTCKNSSRLVTDLGSDKNFLSLIWKVIKVYVAKRLE